VDWCSCRVAGGRGHRPGCSGQPVVERKRDRIIRLDIKAVPVVADAAALERGKYLFMSRGCGDCQAATGAGRAFIDEPGGGFYVRSPDHSLPTALPVAEGVTAEHGKYGDR